MKKKLFLSVMMGMVANTLVAQYVPNNSQGYQLMPLFNPAFSGVENFNDLKFSYRYQWAGFGKYSPKFINLSYHKRLKQPLDLSYNSMRLSARTSQVPKSKRMIVGMGGNLFQSTVGVIKSVGGSFNLSFNYPLSKNKRLAVGASALIENRKLDLNQVSVRDPDEYYNYLLRSSTAQTDLNLRAGILLYGENFYVGLSYLPLVNIALQATDLALEQPFYRGSFQMGYAFPIQSEVMLKPSILGLVQMNNKLVIDYNVKAFIQDKVFLGLTYRDVQSGVVLLGFNVNQMFTVSYSYEMSLGVFKKFNDGSHELVLSARLNNVKKYTQYTW
jgi:type IX secretion system PorP/SprF family membrane protein